MKPPRTYKVLDSYDPDPEAHVALLLARISRNLHHEPLDLRTLEAAANGVVMLDHLLETIGSHHRAVKALRNLLQEEDAVATLDQTES